MAAIKHITRRHTRVTIKFAFTNPAWFCLFLFPGGAGYDHRMKCIVHIFFAVILLTGFVPGVHAAELTNEKILQDFNIIAFGNEYTLKRYDNVRKWRGPIRIGIQGEKYPAYFEAFVKQHIRDLWNLTGHPIELYYSHNMQKKGELARDFNAAKVNFILYYLPIAEIPGAVAKYFDNDPAKVRKMIEVSTCFAKFFTRKNEITAAIAVFPDVRPRDQMRACVVEELTQVLGLANDSSDVNPSIFNDTSPYFELTDHDRWMLKMFYDPRITAGMPRDQALAIGRQILNEIRPE